MNREDPSHPTMPEPEKSTHEPRLRHWIEDDVERIRDSNNCFEEDVRDAVLLQTEVMLDIRDLLSEQTQLLRQVREGLDYFSTKLQ